MSQRNHARSSQMRRLIQKLSTYAAAGTSLAVTEARAGIVYTDLGPNGKSVGIREMMDVDLDDDNTPDFAFTYDTHSDSSQNYLTFASSRWIIAGLGRNRVIADPGSPFNPGNVTRFESGELINVTQDLPARAALARRAAWFCDYAKCGSSQTGELLDKRGFVGLVFILASDGQSHRGWADVNVSVDFALTLFRFAYETEPVKAIIAGDIGVIGDNFGDTNGDGKVDIVDLNNVRNNFGATGDGVLGDTNADHVVNITDLNEVRNGFGITSGANSVPEPPSLVLLAAGAAGLAMLRRKPATSE